MKIETAKWFMMMTLATLPLVPVYSQGTAPAAVAAVNLPPNVAEVVKLVQSGVGDDVVVAYVKNAQTPYNLSANDIISLKNYGVSSGVISAMLNRDLVLRSQPGPVSSPAAATSAPGSPPGSIPNAPIAPMAPTVAPTVAPVPSAPAPPTTSTIIEQAPPPAQVEVVPISPGPSYYWVPGYWSWNGGWIWVGGRWAPRP
jgi:hypothetical protein